MVVFDLGGLLLLLRTTQILLKCFVPRASSFGVVEILPLRSPVFSETCEDETDTHYGALGEQLADHASLTVLSRILGPSLMASLLSPTTSQRYETRCEEPKHTSVSLLWVRHAHMALSQTIPRRLTRRSSQHLHRRTPVALCSVGSGERMCYRHRAATVEHG